MVQWIRLCTSKAGCTGLIPGQGTKILHATRREQKLKKEKKGFPGGAVVESLPANAGDTGSSPGLGGSHMPRSN